MSKRGLLLFLCLSSVLIAACMNQDLAGKALDVVKEPVVVKEKPIKVRPECTDRKDNDLDGKIDLKDEGCLGRKDTDESNCGDGICEGLEDCNLCEMDCGSCFFEVCSDNVDNDMDNLIDCDDPDCISECNPSIPDYCIDTDYQDFFTKGLINGSINSVPYVYVDFCINNLTLVEYVCSGDYNSILNISCYDYNQSFCWNGKCIR